MANSQGSQPLDPNPLIRTTASEEAFVTGVTRIKGTVLFVHGAKLTTSVSYRLIASHGSNLLEGVLDCWNYVQSTPHGQSKLMKQRK
jgi:hypothetical protein